VRDVTDAAALIADLDPDQRAAVTTESKLVAVIAGAGSGKTRVLTRRVAYRIAVDDADARHTVVLTFTREAAGELRRRLPALGIRSQVVAGTFHSIAYDLLRQRWADLDQRPRSVLDDRRRIVAGLVGREELDDVVGEISWATARGLGPTQYATAAARSDHRPAVPAERICDVLAEYEQEKRRRGVVDLDDLIALTNRELDRDPDYADGVRWRFRHVLVDEAQDLNPLQQRFLDHLRAGRDDLYLVGDPSQAIYGFNGSDPSLLVDAGERFPGVEVVRLPVNHRCTPQIVDAGGFVLAADAPRSDLRSSRPDGRVVEVAAHDDEHAEAAAVTARVVADEPGLRARTAVLGRTHAALTLVRRSLEGAGVDVHTARARAATNPLLREACAQPSSAALRTWANDANEQLLDVDDPDGVRAAVVGAVFDFLHDQPTGDGAALRSWVEATDPLGAAVPGVELLTFHAAKGREWHTVHAIGVETSLVPHRSATTNAARNEEARLLYVALTRATDALHVHWARRRAGYRRKLSPFLDGFDATEPEPMRPPDELATRTAMSTERSALDRLVAWRAATARAGGLVPDAVCSDHALAAIARHRPETADELDAATGLGPLTARRLFDGIREALADAS
jgi:DNA helicase-2/ATP-dependent DNA helicase PcrA